MAVIHFVGLKVVEESVLKPLDYYRVKLTGTIQLLEIMRAHGVKSLVFGNSAITLQEPLVASPGWGLPHRWLYQPLLQIPVLH